MRVDAKADGTEVAIGGWIPAGDSAGNIDKASSPWFSMRLCPESAPWAFSKGRPRKVISALELLATTVGIAVLEPTLKRDGKTEELVT